MSDVLRKQGCSQLRNYVILMKLATCGTHQETPNHEQYARDFIRRKAVPEHG